MAGSAQPEVPPADATMLSLVNAEHQNTNCTGTRLHGRAIVLIETQAAANEHLQRLHEQFVKIYQQHDELSRQQAAAEVRMKEMSSNFSASAAKLREKKPCRVVTHFRLPLMRPYCEHLHIAPGDSIRRSRLPAPREHWTRLFSAPPGAKNEVLLLNLPRPHTARFVSRWLQDVVDI